MKHWPRNVLTCLLIPALLTGCGSQRVVTVPEVVEVVKYERIPVPAELLADCVKSLVPSELTYGQALSLWAEDRAKLDTCGGQIEAIGVLNDGTER